MSKPDKNFLSFTGDKGGNIWRNGLILFTPEVPRSERVVTLTAADCAGITPTNWADILKFSGVRGLTVIVEGILPGGKEDCADFNNLCDDVELIVKDGCTPNGRYGFTVKGGCRNIRIVCDFIRLAKVCELSLGNWSDQSDAITRDVEMASYAFSGWKLRYSRLNATDPELLGGPWKAKFKLPRWLIKPVWLLWGALKKIGLPV